MNRFLMVGVFVIAGLVLFTTGLFMIGNRHEAFAPHVELYTEFANVSGIIPGAKVQVAGMDAGQVLAMEIPQSPSAKFRIKVRVNAKLSGLVRADSVVTVGTEGVVGNRFLEISAGTSRAPAVATGSTLKGVEPTELSAILELAKGTIVNVDNTVRNANSLVTNANGLITSVAGNLNAALDKTKLTISNANEVVTGLKEGREPAGMLLRDEALADEVRQAVTNAKSATGELNRAAAQASTLMSELQSKSLPDQVDDTVKEAKRSVANLDAASAQIRQAITDLTGPDEGGVSAATTVRESLSNVNVAAANIADETEALKHTFLLRGFFNKRGYYSLTGITPDLYRKDRSFAAPNSDRAWLRADRLFHLNSHGVEELTSQGRSALNSALSSYGERILESPIIVEGYSDSDAVSDRLALSRHRAILVRSYLQGHFALDSAKVGALALENRPPDGSDHSTWNGVAIVLLKVKR
jgi:phospholipid/cholesterol/gamma-HCH transport system substrate-binding protein